ncbi:hypothetical protein CEXT_564591 [Caerostris extrusa]|uniref:Uncharacterized protein n=1 Tax=Caerostris extrusa TaxID=172846 RepID=A0AAV4NM38_CAEEX|nr:hypothetical protein CEXT_564591 [Caerostris extrusa]
MTSLLLHTCSQVEPDLPRNRQFPYPFAPEVFSTSHRHHRLGVRAIFTRKYPILVTILGHWKSHGWKDGLMASLLARIVRCVVYGVVDRLLSARESDIFLNCTATASCLCQKKVDG